MAVRDILGPRSLDQIFFVFISWTIILAISNFVVEGSLLRLEVVVSSGVLLAWCVWGVYYRLEQVQKERHRRDT